jgi:hypothetical protein
MSVSSILRRSWRSGLAAFAILFFAMVDASVGPAPAQMSGDVLARLRSLPPQAQRNALRRWLHFYEPRAYPNQQIPPGAMQRALRDHEQKFGAIRPQLPPRDSPQFNQNVWSPLGPAPIGTSPNTDSGRISSVAIHPTDANTIYIGAATGGVWKTTNGGTSWTPLTDTQCSTAMGSIAIDPSNPQIVYAGTGELHFSLDSYYGCGVLKSTDGGATWTQLGASIFDTTSGGATISKVVINPTSTQTVLVASSFGLYRSTNGGASFTQVLAQTPVTDLVVDPTNTLIWYAAVGNLFGSANNGVYRSSDGGVNWVKLAGGLPTANVGRFNIAIAASSPTTLYASVQNSSTFALLGLWQTTNGGTTWTQLTATGASCAFQCWYDMYVAVDPTNAAIVYFGGLSLYRSTNSGASFTDIGATIHVDHHSFAFLPGTPTTIFAGSDGGIFRSTNSGTSWSSLNSNLAITQFYSGISLHPTAAGTVMGGTQDNGTLRTTGALAWTNVIGGDGGFTAIDFATPTTAYGETQWTPPGCGFCGPRRSDNVGVSAFNLRTTGINLNDAGLFIPPLIMSPSTATTLFFGTNKVYRTTNRGDNWTASGTTLGGNVTHIAQAPSNAAIIYAGASNGLVYKSTDTNATYGSFSTGLPARVPNYLVVHPTDPNTAFVAVSGFGSGHVWKTTNGGTNWTNISGNLLDVPVNAIVLDPTNPVNEIIIGTDLGVYRTHDGGTIWTPFNIGLPNVPILDLKYNPTTGVLAAGTHGRGVFTASLNAGVFPAAHDFNGEGKSDIAFRQTSTGAVAIWLMNDASMLQSAVLGAVVNNWQIVGQRDFNGDGKHDLLWRDTSGNNAIWFLNGVSVTSTAGLPNVPTTWSVAGTGDFNADGKGDLLWRDTAGVTAIWLLNGATVVQTAAIGTIPAPWIVAGIADFNGDGKKDILWRNTSTGVAAIWFIDGVTVTSTAVIGTVPPAWTIVATGDFNGDGKADILWRDTSGNVAIWLMNGATVSSTAALGLVATNWIITETGDFNRDGRSDLLWRDNTTGTIAIWFINGTTVSAAATVGVVSTDWVIQNAGAN